MVLASIGFHWQAGMMATLSRYPTNYSRGYVFCDLALDHDQRTVIRALMAAMRQWQVIPKALLFDNGSPFKGTLLSTFCKKLGIRVIHTAVRHPQTNGKLERAFQDDMWDFYRQYDEWLLDHLRHDMRSYVHYRIGTGLRRSEVVGLDLHDYDVATGALVVRAGKGNKDRQLFAGHGAAQAMCAWLAIRGTAPGPLFLPINKGGRLIVRRLSDKAIVHILKERAAEAAIKAFSPHDLRRSFISGLLSSGVDLVTVSAMAGHASVTTTAKYDRRGEEAKRQAAERLIIPFVPVYRAS